MSEIIARGTLHNNEILIDSSEVPVVSGHYTSGAIDTVVAELTGTGTLSATIHVEYSSDLATWTKHGEILLSDTKLVSGAVVTTDHGPLVRFLLASISGVDAHCTLTTDLGSDVSFRVPLEYLITD